MINWLCRLPSNDVHAHASSEAGAVDVIGIVERGRAERACGQALSTSYLLTRAIPSIARGGYTACMNRRPALAYAILAIILPLALSACGNKGPLVLPDAPADTPVDTAVLADTPAVDDGMPVDTDDDGTPAR